MSPSCTDDDGAISAAQEDDGPPPLRSVLTWRVALPIGIYAALGFIDIAYMALFPLFCVSVHERAWISAGYGVWGKEEYMKRFWSVVDWNKAVKVYENVVKPSVA